ncbi:MAG TPA: hypothetical protein VGA03_03920 [Anaerolineales bacterium]
MDAFKTLVKQLTKNFEKLPGWVPLLVVVYAIAAILPEDSTVLGLSLKDHREILVSVTTLLAYQLGDAIDKAIYKSYVAPLLDRRFPKWVDRPRSNAREALGIQEGVYRVAKSLAGAAGEYEGTKIHLWNESAKFARSVALPLILIPLFPQSEQLPGSSLLPVAGLLFFIVYLVLKPLHIGLLYRKAVELAVANMDGRYAVHDLPTGIRLFFWDGELVASERLDRDPLPAARADSPG